MFNTAIMSYFPWRRKSDITVKATKKELLIQACQKRDYLLFSRESQLCSFQAQDFYDDNEMSPLHLALYQPTFEMSSPQKRNNIYQIVTKILATPMLKDAWLNKQDNQGQTPLHLAVRFGFAEVVSEFLENDANFTLEDKQGRTALRLASELGEDDIYKKLLQHHRNKNAESIQKFQIGQGYTLGQINSALKFHEKKLKMRNGWIGGVGAFMVIACPVATVLAFGDLPLIGGLLSSFLPGVGPIIGLVAGLVFAGMLFWAVHNKSSLKYGKHQQKLSEIEAKNAHLDRLSADLNHLRYQKTQLSKEKDKASTIESSKNLENRIQAKQNEIKQFCSAIPEVLLVKKIKDEDWATPLDVLKTRLLTAGGFLCAFSGMLGVCGVISSFLPAVGFTAVVLAGIPVGGWIALGLALVVATSVAIWACLVKFKPTLKDYGKARRELNEAEAKLYERSVELSDENKLLSTSTATFASRKIYETTEKPNSVQNPNTRIRRAASFHSMADLLSQYSGTFISPQKNQIKGSDSGIANLRSHPSGTDNLPYNNKKEESDSGQENKLKLA